MRHNAVRAQCSWVTVHAGYFKVRAGRNQGLLHPRYNAVGVHLSHWGAMSREGLGLI